MEWRIDPLDGMAYTKLDFVAYYDGWYAPIAIEAYWHSCTPIPGPVTLDNLAVHCAALEYLEVELTVTGDDLALRRALRVLAMACIQALPVWARVPKSRRENTPEAVFEAVSTALGRKLTRELRSRIGKAYREDYAPYGKTQRSRPRRQRRRDQAEESLSLVMFLSTSGHVCSARSGSTVRSEQVVIARDRNNLHGGRIV